MTQRFANSDFSRYVAAARLFPMPTIKAATEAAAEEREAAEDAAPAPAPRIKRATGAHGVTLADSPTGQEMAATGQGGAFPLWATGAERRPAAALLCDIAEAAAARALFS